MFQLEKNNKKVGAYLNKFITAKYNNVRTFCKEYLKLAGSDWEDDVKIGNMQNRMSQIINGNKAIQTYDLPIVCELLNVSCEEILSAGKHFVPISGHVTNYEIAFSKDKATWDKYINRDDKLILNPDEYNKTVIDYAFEFKNYEFLKYLMDNKYIWFVDNSECDSHELTFGFGAGTSIKRRDIGNQDTLGSELYYQSEEKGLRQKMIALAIENNNLEMLASLRSRENPALYQAITYVNPQTSLNDYYDENVLEEIARSNDKIIGYFSEDFTIEDIWGHQHKFIYPYIDKLIELLIKNKHKYVEAVLRRAIEHNKNVFAKLQELINEAFELTKKRLPYLNDYDIAKITMESCQYGNNDFIVYSFAKSKGDDISFRTNIVHVEAESNDLLIKTLIEEINESYNAAHSIQPDTSKYE